MVSKHYLYTTLYWHTKARTTRSDDLNVEDEDLCVTGLYPIVFTLRI